MRTTSTTLRPRRHLHRGTVRASALWFDPALLGEGEARRRVLAAWTPGAVVFSVAGGYLLRLSRPCVVASDSAPGLPLTLEQGVLSSAPLSAAERGHPELRDGTVVLMRAGQAHVHVLTGARAVDLSEWLDVSAWVTLPVRGLGAPPPPVPALEPLPPPTRAFFGPSVPTLAPEAQVMLARMQGKPPPEGLVVAEPPGLLARLRAALFGGQEAGAAGGPTAARRAGLLARLRAAMSGRGVGAASPASASSPGLLARLRAAFRSATGSGDAGSGSTASRPGLLSRLAAWFQRGAASQSLPSGAGTAAGGMQRGSAASKPRRPSWLSRFLAYFAPTDEHMAGATGSGDSGAAPSGPPPAPPGPSMLSRLSEWMLRNTPLGELLGRRKAEYVRRLFDLFEEGNLQEALRYAIPLGTNELSENARIALGVPGPRESLSIQPSRGGAASVFAGGEALFSALKERYREAFRRFEREGRIDEAAFILAELLGAHEEAVSFLERHGRFKLAAELAEGRNLSPGLVVRQWFLAKDVARATAIARRSGAFADAVLRLERTHPEQARVLRLLWGETLAESGDWARAVQAVWPITDARALARGWLERGVACGGASGARLLALWVTAFPDGLAAASAQVRELLDDSPERAPERFAFALTLAGESPSAGRTALVVPTVRALLRDRAAGRARFNPDFLTRLLRDAPDGTLRSDLPPLTERSRIAWSTDVSRPPVHATVRETDDGAFPVHDAVALPDGRLLLALGEAGARLVRADGQLVAHFDVPAFALVPSVHGDRALAIAPRGEVRRLSRLDLVARRATPWCDAAVDTWAPTYDGSVWFVASRRTVMMVDALANDLRALWRVPDVPAPVHALAVDAGRLSLLTGDRERWTYELPQGPTLRARTPLLTDGDILHFILLGLSLTADGESAAVGHVTVQGPPSPESPGVPGLPREEVRLFWLRPLGSRAATPPERLRPGRAKLLLSDAWRVDVLWCTGHWQLHLVDARGTARALLVFEGETRPRVRLTDTALLAFDERGRLLVLDLEEGIARHVAVR
ncbi:bpX6 domain-containing protein [Pyxidicoccus caerfyrddinensis]|uniref:bpX6 domain-containing protein n=1 Tax=Pyxidicoccus caerfyrddinensis TaxID=2709663 RepID=UPI0013DA10A1|nr:bpX6 domain-containing protein [Pyxidicoccus caerfyrddinensis]